MNSQVYPAVVAIVVGAAVGVVLFVPFVAVQYRRAGRLTFGQLALWSAFLVYGFALWTYTLLPMPARSAVRCVGAQTTPLRFLDDIRQYPYASLGALAHNPAFMQFALNVLLFVPLGFFIRMIWRRGFVVSTVAGFAISLLIETTQRTGVWGLYRCAYRFFDVDDLIANTGGAFVGAILSIALIPMLSRRRGGAVVGPRRVTLGRRALGMLCDALSFFLVGMFAGVAVQAFRYVVLDRELSADSAATQLAVTAVPLVVFGLIAVTTGRTPGDMAVQLSWADGVRPLPLRGLLRFAGGIGGWQALAAFAPGWDALFLVAVVIAVIATPRRGGLPGLLSGARPVDARAAAASHPRG